MQRKTKTILTVIGGVLIVGVLAVVGVAGYLYFSYTSKNETAFANGQAFGKASDTTGCVDESIRQFKEFKENTFFSRLEEMHIGRFTRGCLATARETPNFCDGVPSAKDIIGEMHWSFDRCDKAGLDHNGPCNEIFTEVAKSCPVKKPDVVSYPN